MWEEAGIMLLVVWTERLPHPVSGSRLSPPRRFLHQSQHICCLARVHGRDEMLAVQAGICSGCSGDSVVLQCHWRSAFPLKKTKQNTFSGMYGATVKV